ncbi:hypothetical protein HAX54_011248 [Datura stramonium]|uniref:Uncharacterized protein n=1 Tax=Datura stramonium TaxID=4076 RepID=A0ABS8TJ51_DATST|nr:hypothetical protein [Datura stramonium]
MHLGPQVGSLLLDSIQNTELKTALSGEFRLINGELHPSPYQIMNIDGTAESAIFRGWELPPWEEAKVGVPVKGGLQEFIKVRFKTQGVTATGFCADVFKEVIRSLPYAVPYNLFHERSNYVDFTLPLQVGYFRCASKDDDWEECLDFRETSKGELWITTAAFFVSIGLWFWVLRHRVNKEFQRTQTRASWDDILVSFSTLVFAHSVLKGMRFDSSKFRSYSTLEEYNVRSQSSKMEVLVQLLMNCLISDSSSTNTAGSILCVLQAFPKGSPLVPTNSQGSLEAGVSRSGFRSSPYSSSASFIRKEVLASDDSIGKKLFAIAKVFDEEKDNSNSKVRKIHLKAMRPTAILFYNKSCAAASRSAIRIVPHFRDSKKDNVEAASAVSYRSVIVSPSANDDQILKELYNVNTKLTRVFVVHLQPYIYCRFSSNQSWDDEQWICMDHHRCANESSGLGRSFSD